VHEAAPEPAFSLTLKRNCSISPKALGWLLASMMLVSFVIGVVFALLGAWMILPFAGLEMAAVAAAFYLHGRHASDYERIVLRSGRLVVEVCEADTTLVRELNPQVVRVAERQSARDYSVALLAEGREIEVGRHLDEERRRLLAATLRQQLGNTSRGMAATAAWRNEGWIKR
jgi:uncharacterized membrane protein